MADADVVISGAGPNGLMLACELALAGVQSVVLDKLPGPSDEPKANGLVGQVIRQLDMRGLYHAFGGQDGPPQPMYEWRFAGIPVNFLGVEDNPMYALLLQQPRLVRLLEKRARDLGVDVRWGHELTGLASTQEGVTVTVASPERNYDLDATYLVGADGGRSPVRKAVGIDFPGSTSDTVAPDRTRVSARRARDRRRRLPDSRLRPAAVRTHQARRRGPHRRALPARPTDARDNRIRAFPGLGRDADDARRTAGEYPARARRGAADRSAARAGPACAAPDRRAEQQAGGDLSGAATCCCSATPRTSTRRWVGPA